MLFRTLSSFKFELSGVIIPWKPRFALLLSCGLCKLDPSLITSRISFKRIRSQWSYSLSYFFEHETLLFFVLPKQFWNPARCELSIFQSIVYNWVNSSVKTSRMVAISSTVKWDLYLQVPEGQWFQKDCISRPSPSMLIFNVLPIVFTRNAHSLIIGYNIASPWNTLTSFS